MRGDLIKFAFLIFMSSLLKGMKTAGNLSKTEFLGSWDITREQCTMSTAGVAAQEMRVPLKTGFLHTNQGMGSLKTCWGSHSGFEKWVRLQFDLLHLQVYEMSTKNTWSSTNLWFIYNKGFFFFPSTFFNVDPITVAYNLNPSTEQHLPSIGKYRLNTHAFR